MPNKKQNHYWKKILFALFFLGMMLPHIAFCFADYAKDNSDEKKRYEVSRKLMGVKFRFVIYAESYPIAEKSLLAAIQRVAEIEEKLTDYDPDSELMRLCKNAKAGVPVKVSEELFCVLVAADKVHSFSKGAFDPTIGSLSKLWRKARRVEKLPENDEITEALGNTGWDHLELSTSEQTVTFKKIGLKLDLGGIAKGYAADEAIKTLNKHGISQALVDASGDVTVSDPPPGRKGWKVAIESHDSESFLSLRNASIATSGDKFQFLEIGGKKYSHIIDPKTGLGTTHQNLVTVVCKSKEMPGMFADAYASAFSVMNGDLIHEAFDLPARDKHSLKGLDAVFVRIKTKPDADSGIENIESKNFSGLYETK